MTEHPELLWQLVNPWLRPIDLVCLDKKAYLEGMPDKREICSSAARKRVMKSLIKHDYADVLLHWLRQTTPSISKKFHLRGRLYSSEDAWLLDYARASASPRCAELLSRRGASDGKGPKTRGGRQGKWMAWI